MRRRGGPRAGSADRRSTHRSQGSPARRRLGLAAVVVALALTAAACFPAVAPPPPVPKAPKPKSTTSTTLAAPAQLTIAPGAVDFADDPRPGGETQAFVVSNVGGSTSGVLGAPEIVTGGAPEFSVDAGTCDDGTGRLAAGATCELIVTFTADEGGGNVVAPTSVSIGASPGGTVTAELTGTEHDTTQLTIIADPPYPFFDSNEPDGANTEVFEVHNPTAFVMTGLEVAIEDLTPGSGFFFLADGCPDTLAPVSSCEVTIDFVDESGTGLLTTATFVASADFSDDAEVLLRGQSTGEPNLMSVFPLVANITDSISEAGPDASQITVMMTITNNGAVPTGLLQEELVQFGPQVSTFTIDDFAGDCVVTPVQLNPGQSCFLMVSFDALGAGQETLEVRVRATPGGFVRTIVSGLPTA